MGAARMLLVHRGLLCPNPTNSQVTIKDGYTIALGGLTAETEDNESSKIPFWGDLPLLGQPPCRSQAV